MFQEEKSRALLLAEARLKQAKSDLARAKREERKKARKEQDHHKFIMGGIVCKYFPECYDFSEQELNRIIACAFKNRDVLNMIANVRRERDNQPQNELNNEEE